MKLSHFHKGLSWLLLLNIIVKPVWIFGIDSQVQNRIGHEEYGSYFSLLNLSIVLSFIADAGITNRMNLRLAAQQAVDVRKMFQLKCFLSVLYCLVVLFFGWISGITRWEVLLLVIGIQILTSFLLFFRSIVTANQFFKADAWLSIADKTLMLVVCGVLLYAPFYSGDFDLYTFLYIQLGCMLTAVVIAGMVGAKYLSIKPHRENFSIIFKTAIPFVVLILLMSVHNRLDGFLLERLHSNGAYEAGVYASAYRLLDAGNMVGYLAASFLVPFVARNKEDIPLISGTVLSLRHLLLLASVTIIAFVAVFSMWLQQLLYPSLPEYNSLILVLCIAALPAYFLTHIYGSVLTAQGLLQRFIPIVLLSVTLNLLLNFCFIETAGALACCTAAITSQYVCGIACMLTVTNRTIIPLHILSIFVYLFAAVFLYVLFFVGHYAAINAVVLLATGCGVAALIMFALWYQTKKKYFLP